jgi:hypothetical protein
MKLIKRNHDDEHLKLKKIIVSKPFSGLEAI